MAATIYDTVAGKYISGWSSTGLPKLTDDVKYAETMLRSAANRVAENLNNSSYLKQRYVVR